MKTYEARYTITSMMFDGGAFMPNPEAHYDSRMFKAKNDKESRVTAEELKTDVGRNYYVEKITIDSIVEVLQERETREIKQ